MHVGDSNPPKAQSLAALREQLRTLVALGETDGLQDFAASLQSDARTGAQKMVESATRQRASILAERERVDRMFDLRRELHRDGWKLVAGVDEVGVGPLAGPVTAAAVILPDEVDLPGINDSKKLSRGAREKLDLTIREQAIAWCIGSVSPEEIDRLNIFQASLEAMRRAVSGLTPAPDYLMVDARTVPGTTIQQRGIVHGDSIDASIAAASIIAKVHRDRLMADLDEEYPGYGFAQHSGYGTVMHLEALEELGACPVHRLSFGPVTATLGRAGDRR